MAAPLLPLSYSDESDERERQRPEVEEFRWGAGHGGGRSCSNGSCCFVPGDFVEWERAGNNPITTDEFGGEFGSRDSVSWMVLARHNNNTTITITCLLLLRIVDFKFYGISNLSILHLLANPVTILIDFALHTSNCRNHVSTKECPKLWCICKKWKLYMLNRQFFSGDCSFCSPSIYCIDFFYSFSSFGLYLLLQMKMKLLTWLIIFQRPLVYICVLICRAKEKGKRRQLGFR